MVTKTILIHFANPRIRAVDHFSDICEAADHAHYNLYIRHKVRLYAPYQSDNNVFIKMEIPDESCENFNPGNHLRGISAYLIKKHGDAYRKYRVGNRLFYFLSVED